jgi:hypothetical protein
MILVEADDMMKASLVLYCLIDLLIECLHEEVASSLACIDKYLVASLIDPLTLILGQSVIEDFFSDGIACECDKIDPGLALKVRSELSFNEGALAHPWDAHRHYYENRLGSIGRHPLYLDLLYVHLFLFMQSRRSFGLIRSIFRNIIDLHLLLALQVSSSPG